MKVDGVEAQKEVEVGWVGDIRKNPFESPMRVSRLIFFLSSCSDGRGFTCLE